MRGIFESLGKRNEVKI